MRNRAIVMLSFATLLIFLVACASPSQPPTPSGMEITDQLGRVVRLAKIPERIVSLSPGNTEILFALGLGDRVVAVTDYDDYPPEATQKPKIGGFSTPSIEKIVALEPDLLLAASIHEKRIIPQLEQRGLAVLALTPQTLDGVLAAITLVGKATGTENQAAKLVSDMTSRIKAVTDKTSQLTREQRPGVFYAVWHDPLMAAGSGTLLDELIQKAGGVNIASKLSGYADISLEAVVEASPAVMIAGTGHGTGAELPFQYLQTEPRLGNTDARKNNRVYMVDANVATRPGPRLVEALEIFVGFIHPELFK